MTEDVCPGEIDWLFDWHATPKDQLVEETAPDVTRELVANIESLANREPSTSRPNGQEVRDPPRRHEIIGE